MSVSASPFPDCRALLAVDRRATPTRTNGTSTPAATDAATSVHPLLQIISKLCSVLCREVDLIAHTVETKFHSLVSGTFTVEIIDQGDGNFFCHYPTALPRYQMRGMPHISGTNLP
ncbi:hypothetical protein AWC12_15800 [Mycolicibacterium iranicum]|uniref:Uncharacterized protein n=1 Tax=Mycolicibacterium iranicum TaxID=912594 RepID=A0A1X1WMQ0_MYCIR|nr:hypothetical protein AWC12_15800 [Mycolicibacterium iranicum]